MSILINFGSWEERFILSAKHDLESSNKIRKVVCFYFEDGQHVKKTHENIEQFKSELPPEIVFELIAIKFYDYKFSWERLELVCNKFDDSDVILNISTMTRNIIFSMFHFLDKLSIPFKIKYYPADSHTNELTKNPSMPEMIFQHGGIMYPHLKTVLIVIVGYDPKRVLQLYNFFEPMEIYIGIGSNNKTNIPEEFDVNFTEIPNKHIFNVDSFSKECVFNDLEDIYLKLKGKYNVLVCSLGPKVETIGVYKFHKKNPSVGLVYAPSKDYSINYSSGVNLENVYTVDSKWLES